MHDRRRRKATEKKLTQNLSIIWLKIVSIHTQQTNKRTNWNCKQMLGPSFGRILMDSIESLTLYIHQKNWLTCEIRESIVRNVINVIGRCIPRETRKIQRAVVGKCADKMLMLTLHCCLTQKKETSIDDTCMNEWSIHRHIAVDVRVVAAKQSMPI